MSITDILEAYRTGDDDKRLSLFLAHRDLREIFISIEDELSHDYSRAVDIPWTGKERLPQAA